MKRAASRSLTIRRPCETWKTSICTGRRAKRRKPKRTPPPRRAALTERRPIVFEAQARWIAAAHALRSSVFFWPRSIWTCWVSNTWPPRSQVSV